MIKFKKKAIVSNLATLLILSNTVRYLKREKKTKNSKPFFGYKTKLKRKK